VVVLSRHRAAPREFVVDGDERYRVGSDCGNFSRPLVNDQLANVLQGWGISQWWVRLPFLLWFGHLLLASFRDMYLRDRVQIVEEAKRGAGGVSALDAALADKRERLALLRNALNKHADEAPSEASFTRENGRAWLHGADLLLRDSLKQTAWSRFWRSDKNYDAIRTSVASLRSLAASIRIDDLAK
jgi:hypothetical protein